MTTPGIYLERPLPDGRHIDVYPLTFGRARLSVAPTVEDQTFYLDSY